MKNLIPVLGLVTIFTFSSISCIKISKTDHWGMYGSSKIDLAGVDTTINVEWQDFKKLDAYGEFKIDYRKGSDNSIVIKGDKAIARLLSVKYDDNILEIYPKENFYLSNKDDIDKYISITITTDKISNIDANGSTNIVFDGDFVSTDEVSFNLMGLSKIKDLKLTAPSMFLEFSGASSLDGNTILNIEDLEVVTSGASNINDVKINGTNIELDLSGASIIDDTEINGANLKLEASGASNIDANVNISELIDFNLTGASKIEMSGIANNITGDTSGASSLDIKKLNVKGKKKLNSSGSSSIEEN